jgi:DNA gyrase subunit A
MSEEKDDLTGKIAPISLEEEMATSYMQFAMSTIMARGLPDVRDGLKPSQRRILIAMRDDNLTPDRPHSKCAAIVGQTMKVYHPHGDASIYGTLVHMGQDFNTRYPPIDPMGNFGSVDGDPAGAPRYTEARLSNVAMIMLEDLDRDTVDFQPTYDERNKEPVVLPAMFPNLICNGSAGIVPAYATNMPPHNVSEVVDVCIAMLDDPDLSVDKIMELMPGPDFPSRGFILGTKGIRKYYETGNGSVVMQARAVIEPLDRNRTAIIVTELPYLVSKSALLIQIAKLHEENKVGGISDLRDESDRKGMRVVIELKRDANPNVVLNQLYKHTLLRTSFGANMMAVVPVPGTQYVVPRLLGVRDLINQFLTHRREVVTRRTKFLLKQAEDRAHIVEGLLKALDILDEIIALVRSSANRTEARQGLMQKWGFSEKQAESILSMQLGQLTRLSRIELEREMSQLDEAIREYREILASEERKSEVIKSELRRVKREFGDDRRTRIIPGEADEIQMEDLIAQEDMTITITRDGYIKRLPVDTYRLQKRGGKGVVALSKKEEDDVRDVFVATTHHLIFSFTSLGMVYHVKAYQVPMASRQSRGTPIINLVPIEQDEAITAMIPISSFDIGGYLVMVTEGGLIKKTALSEYNTALKSRGIIAINLRDGDRLKWVMWTDGTKDIMISTSDGFCIRFDEAEVRPMGRNAAGVHAIKLREGDRIVSTAAVNKDDPRDLLVVGEQGLGKRTPLSDYPRKGRATQGVITLKVTDRTGPVVGVQVVEEEDEVMCISSQGVLIRVPVADIRQTGRNAQGVKVVTPREGDSVTALAKVVRYAGESPEDAVGS